jgi:hypothetical protein
MSPSMDLLGFPSKEHAVTIQATVLTLSELRWIYAYRGLIHINYCIQATLKFTILYAKLLLLLATPKRFDVEGVILTTT